MAVNLRTLYNTHADLYRVSISAGALGGTSRTLAIESNDMPCRVSNSTPSERMVGDTKFSEATGVVYCPGSISVQRGDEIRHGSNTYEVLGVRTLSKRNAHQEVIVERQQRAD